ncbi:hypothetical protein ERICIV_00940 [Paenibacillus larvae subsp. larvae]|uniref:Uncharacterized protein n=1 Tax=Paenibacillus larvae subsp. larvae TaxID=147375 RepID=A0A2L1UAF3_9BACL|nr:hypothetical protein [Paenibacillus larvae]AVF25125.1 hypothetical protein ERICIII_00920 [Paenibacillus larvae subsp. larvae]AVF29903.1 hypothetical protein ERICIV_00940 [Paenibacillus larvae subsp. larvae]MCY7522382.1 hypothetical protein [Paenibacillus larvae]MCY9503272.1 hypothetical protein [Paenibacillus larvae]MCY9681167.1 hypothetical protein [Paenibacillus larvae]
MQKWSHTRVPPVGLNEILEQKKQTLAQIEKDLKEGNKSVETLTEEFENLRKVQELNP